MKPNTRGIHSCGRCKMQMHASAATVNTPTVMLGTPLTFIRYTRPDKIASGPPPFHNGQIETMVIPGRRIPCLLATAPLLSLRESALWATRHVFLMLQRNLQSVPDGTRCYPARVSHLGYLHLKFKFSSLYFVRFLWYAMIGDGTRRYPSERSTILLMPQATGLWSHSGST